jgi:hypothetical protein
VSVAVGDNKGYALWYDESLAGDLLCDVRIGAMPWQRTLVFDRREYGRVPKSGATLLVLLYAGKYRADRHIGTTAGLASERFKTGIDGLCGLRLALSEMRGGRPYLRIWDEGTSDASADAHSFTVEDDGATICFGDGYHGVNVPAGRQVIAIEARQTSFDGGNVMPNSIKCKAAEGFGNIEACNPLAASGGVRRQTAAVLLRDIKGHVLAPVRAVGVDDYRDLVLTTPGLMLDGMAVVPAKDYAAFYTTAAKPVGNVVYVAVKPTAAGHPKLTDSYRQAIEQRLDAARLLTVRPVVCAARYAGVEVYGRVVLSEDSEAARRGVLEAIEQMIDAVGDCRFGGRLGVSALFACIEMQPQVRYAYGVTLSNADRHAHKTEEGDIAIAPDALAYLAKAELEFIEGPAADGAGEFMGAATRGQSAGNGGAR